MEHLFLATHGGRIRCLLQKYFKGKIVQHGYNNCAIVKLYKRENYLYAELFYEGEVTKGHKLKRKHHTKETFGKIKSNNFFTLDLDNKIIYLIRHGEGIHNTHSLLEKFTTQLLTFDPELTEEGIKQAENCGNFLHNYLVKNKIDKSKVHFYSSYMKRAYTTIANIMKKCEMHHNKNIFIVPCSHEIPYKKSGNCDNVIFVYAENRPKCFKNIEKCDTVLDYKLNWDHFKLTNDKLTKTKYNCKNINLLYFFINE